MMGALSAARTRQAVCRVLVARIFQDRSFCVVDSPALPVTSIPSSRPREYCCCRLCCAQTLSCSKCCNPCVGSAGKGGLSWLFNYRVLGIPCRCLAQRKRMAQSGHKGTNGGCSVCSGSFCSFLSGKFLFLLLLSGRQSFWRAV